MEIGTAGQWASAVATFTAVLVALFKDELMKHFKKPNLNIVIELAQPSCTKTTIPINTMRIAPTNIIAECYFLRMAIENTGKTRARLVQVFVKSVSRKNADGSFSVLKRFLPMNLRWSVYIKDPEIFADGISPLMKKHCNIGRIIDPKYRKDAGDDLPDAKADKALFALQLEAIPNDKSHILIPGIYLIELIVAAENCEPVSKKIEINFTGEWYSTEEEMFSQGLGIIAI